MALQYGYFDSEIIGVDEEGMPIFDRGQTSDFLATFISTLVSDGVLGLPGDCFQVVANGGMNLKVKPGFGIIRGRLAVDRQEFDITLSAASTMYKRIDRVILRANYLHRKCEIIVREGVPASTPSAPELIRPAAGDYYELCLATIEIGLNRNTVTQANITDTRYDSSVCGIVTQLIDHLDTDVLYAQFNQFYSEFTGNLEAWFSEMDEEKRIKFDAFVSTFNNMFSKYTKELDDFKNSAETEFFDWLTGNTNNWEEEFFTWFNNLKEQLTDNVAINLQNQIGNLSELQTNAKGSLTAAVNELKGGAGMADVLKRWRTNSPSTTLNRRCRIATVTFTNTFAEAHYMIAVSEHEVNAGSAVFVWNIATGAVKNAVEKNTIDYLAICGKLITNKNTFYTEAVKSDSGVTFNLWCQPLENHNTFDLTLLNVSSNRGENESPLITNPAYESAEAALPGEVSYPLLPSYSSISDIYGKTYVSMGRKPGTAVGDKSIAFGQNVTATGKCSQAFGVDTIAGSEGQFVTGRLNTETLAGMSGYAVIVGGGANGIRKDIYTLDFDGNGFYERSVHARKEILSEQEIKVRKTYGMGGLDEYFLTKTMQLIESGGVYDGIVTLPLKEGRIYLLLTAEWNSSNDRVYGFRARMYTTPIGAGTYNLVAPTAGNLCASTNAGVTLGSVQTEDNYGITLKAGTNYTVSYFLYATGL